MPTSPPGFCCQRTLVVPTRRGSGRAHGHPLQMLPCVGCMAGWLCDRGGNKQMSNWQLWPEISCLGSGGHSWVEGLPSRLASLRALRCSPQLCPKWSQRLVRAGINVKLLLNVSTHKVPEKGKIRPANRSHKSYLLQWILNQPFKALQNYILPLLLFTWFSAPSPEILWHQPFWWVSLQMDLLGPQIRSHFLWLSCDGSANRCFNQAERRVDKKREG